MSDLSETPSRPNPAIPPPEQVTDPLGRVLKVQRLDALRELDLIEAAGGQNADNRRWMMMVTLACYVTHIDGRPLPWPNDRKQIREHVQRVGSEGIGAVMDWLAPDEKAPDADEAELAATAKN